MRVVFVDNVLLERTPRGYDVDLQPHLGLISLIAVIERAGHEGVLYDPKLSLTNGEARLDATFYAATADRILAHAPDVVGFTSLGCNFVCTYQIASEIRRRRPDVPLLLGGPHATIVDEHVLTTYACFDAIARGEAEATILPMLDALAGRGRFADISGVTYRSAGRVVRTEGDAAFVDLDALPMPAYDKYPIAALGLRNLRVDAGRGCPFSCTFCSTASFFGRRYRLKSSARLVAELDELAARYGVRHFSLTHDLFTVNKVKVAAFCDAVADRGYTWTCSARMDCVDDALLERMAHAGCRSIYYGIETGSARMQQVARKNLDLELYHPTLARTFALGMEATASFITGYPEERGDDQAATLDLIGDSLGRYGDELTLQLHLLTPEPGTDLHRRFVDTLAYDGHVTDFNFPTLAPDDAQLMASDPNVFVCHQYYPCAELERVENIRITEVFRPVCELGRPLVRELLRPFGGSLAAFMRAFVKFLAREEARFGVLDAEAGVAFVESEHGADSLVAAAVRYVVTASRLPAETEPRVSAVGAEDVVRLASDVGTIEEGPDGAAALRHLQTHGTFADASVAHARFLVARDGEALTTRSYEVDDLTFALATLLRDGTSVAELRALVGEDALDERMRAFAESGMLVAGDGRERPHCVNRHVPRGEAALA